MPGSDEELCELEEREIEAAACSRVRASRARKAREQKVAETRKARARKLAVRIRDLRIHEQRDSKAARTQFFPRAPLARATRPVKNKKFLKLLADQQVLLRKVRAARLQLRAFAVSCKP